MVNNIEHMPIKVASKHPRAEADYMSTLLEVVTQEDWGDVVRSALVAAKACDGHSRAWLSQYLIGKPDVRAPLPLTVVVEPLKSDVPTIVNLEKR